MEYLFHTDVLQEVRWRCKKRDMVSGTSRSSKSKIEAFKKMGAKDIESL